MSKLKEKERLKMNSTKAEAIVTQLLTNAANVKYGSVSVMLKLHDGRVVAVTYTKTEHTKEQDSKKDNT